MEIRFACLQLPTKVEEPIHVRYTLSGADLVVGECTIPSGQSSCDSPPVTTLGWHWEANGLVAEQRTIQASAEDALLGNSDMITILPRPVVMVHGFSSSWQAWENYLGPQGL